MAKKNVDKNIANQKKEIIRMMVASAVFALLLIAIITM